MTKLWKKNDELDPLAQQVTTLDQARALHPSRLIESKRKYCSYCGNFETACCNLKKLTKFLDEGYVRLVIKTIREKNLESFTIKDLIKAMNAQDITEGTAQRKAMAILCCLGFYKKINTEYISNKKKGTISLKYTFIKVLPIQSPPCYNIETDKHDNKLNDSQWKIIDNKIKVEDGTDTL